MFVEAIGFVFSFGGLFKGLGSAVGFGLGGDVDSRVAFAEAVDFGFAFGDVPDFTKTALDVRWRW